MNETVLSRHGEAPLLDVQHLRIDYHSARRRPPVHAVDDVSFTVGERETVGLVGESGSGKTTIGRAILGLVPITDGAVRYAGNDITTANHRERRRLSRHIQVVFQDPYSSLNPTRTIGQTLAETLRGHDRIGRREVNDRVQTMLERVGLTRDAQYRYPAHFSGGQRQRIAIARALMVQPQLVVCDEPVSSLDLSVQAHVLNLLRTLQDDFGLSYLFIAHDLAVVRHLSQWTIVLYRGQIMEQGPAATIHKEPKHPYTHALHAAAPIPDPELQRARRASRAARTAGLAAPNESGCPFASRCPWVLEQCVNVRPPLEATGRGSSVACHRWRELKLDTEPRQATVAEEAEAQNGATAGA
jgi:oligopeptide/dipeptide ABC transporter ATP-binding protein